MTKLPSIELAQLSSVTGGFPGQGALGKVAKKLPGIGTVVSGVQAVHSGMNASRQYTQQERSAGFQPSGAQQFGAGAVNATSTFINNQMYGLPQFILDHTRPRADQH